jgi:ribosomal protein RSM22 (predicted rRNA methylase)
VQLPDKVRRRIQERADDYAFPALRRAASELSDAYRQGKALPLSRPERIAAYLATRMPATYAAAHSVLCELDLRLNGTQVESVLDVGAGAGATSLAALECLEASRFTLFERDAAMAEIARDWLPQPSIRVQDFTWPAAFPPHDLVIASYALSESGGLEIVDRLWEATKVALVVIEPGSPAGFGLVRDIRSRLLAAGAHMLAPCPGAFPCPMQDADWCHFGTRVERTSLHRRLKEAELNYEDEKFSYVALGREPAALAEARIIRRPDHHPGLIVLQTCTGQGLQTVRATKRNRETFRAARRAAWGDDFLPV